MKISHICHTRRLNSWLLVRRIKQFLSSLRKAARVREKDFLGVFMVAENYTVLLVPEVGIADWFEPSVSTKASTEISTVYTQMRNGEQVEDGEQPPHLSGLSIKQGNQDVRFFFCL